MSHQAFIGIGSNLPLHDKDSGQIAKLAIKAIAKLPRTQLLAQSNLYRSEPIDSSGPDYINAVVKVSTSQSPSELLACLQAIENQFARQRPFQNAPRTLDLDLLLYDQLELNTPTLTLPHPAMTQRAFVVRPLSELEPDLQFGKLGSIRQWLTSTQDQRAYPL
jgi:2-amino-4-hydroxy-6-hydroxymethyldihydropteridine diphosphokinase